MKRTNLLWIVALALGWFFDFLFWKHAPGINFAVYVVLCLGGGFLVLGLNGLKPSWKSAALLLPILFFTAASFIRQEGLSLFLSFCFTLGLMGLLAVSYLGGRWMSYGVLDYLSQYARLVASAIARPITFLADSRKQAPVESTDARSGWKRVWAVLRGLLIALPIVAVFAALLSSADLVFAQRLDDFIQLFRLEKLPEYIFRLVYILIGAYALAGIFLHAAQRSRDEKLVGEEKPPVPQFLGFTEAAVVLGAVVALFAVFVVIQFQYFFGGQTNIGLEGYTYSEYARRGFGELVAVAFFSLLLFLGLSAIVKRRSSAQRWTFSGLGLGMVALVGVMLISAFQRLLLYEAAYGFSRLRTYTHVFMIWLGLLLVVVIVLEVLRRERLFAPAALLAAVGFAASLVIMNVDGFIVRQNVGRAAAGQTLDVGYLASLSTDSVPALATAFQDPALSSGTREAVGAVLACRQATAPSRQDGDWRSFTLSRWQADRGLNSIRSELDGFHVTQDRGLIVETPGGKVYDCLQSGMD
jgi:hypothetical protein